MLFYEVADMTRAFPGKTLTVHGDTYRVGTQYTSDRKRSESAIYRQEATRWVKCGALVIETEPRTVIRKEAWDPIVTCGDDVFEAVEAIL